jgi:hypothetical protein
MAIRDGLAIDLDGARTEAVVRRGKLKYVTPPRQPGPRRVFKIAAALLVLVLIFGAIYYYYTQRDVPDTIHISMAKSAYNAGEEVTVTVLLQNSGPKAHSYTLSTSQTFGLEIINSSGGVVAEYSPDTTQQFQKLSTEPGRSLRLGEFSWNQTVLGYDGGNETWTQVPPGDYVIKAYFKGSADISAEKRITIG